MDKIKINSIIVFLRQKFIKLGNNKKIKINKLGYN